MSCYPFGSDYHLAWAWFLYIILAAGQLRNRCCWGGKQQETYTQMCGMQKGLTCERDSRGSREHRVCLFLLWASRSTNITDHEQPCRAITHNTDSSRGTAEIFALLQVLAVNTLALRINKRGKGNGAPPVLHHLTQKHSTASCLTAHFKAAAVPNLSPAHSQSAPFLQAGRRRLFVLRNFLKHSVGCV